MEHNEAISELREQFEKYEASKYGLLYNLVNRLSKIEKRIDVLENIVDKLEEHAETPSFYS